MQQKLQNPQKKKKKNNGKPWQFTTTHEDLIDFNEVLTTLDRNRPVAVIATSCKNGRIKDSKGHHYILFHSSLFNKTKLIVRQGTGKVTEESIKAFFTEKLEEINGNVHVKVSSKGITFLIEDISLVKYFLELARDIQQAPVTHEECNSPGVVCTVQYPLL